MIIINKNTNLIKYNLFNKRLLSNLTDKFNIKTFNKISEVGLKCFPDTKYLIDKNIKNENAIMLRSHVLKKSEISKNCIAIARCGSGTNNCNVELMTSLGIPVFNTPGANSNSVKELVICAMLLSSRKIIDGVNKVNTIYKNNLSNLNNINEKIEELKSEFLGKEIKGKTIGIIGLGEIGKKVANISLSFDMNVIGYDPNLTIHSALHLPRNIEIADNIQKLIAESDFITIHVPYDKNNTHHLINKNLLSVMKNNATLLNFSRDELIDTYSLSNLKKNKTWNGIYVSDFHNDEMVQYNDTIIIPHLGASTIEAENNSAVIAANTLKKYLETGEINNSVNFPIAKPNLLHDSYNRICVINKNKPGVLNGVMSILSKYNINVEQQLSVSNDKIGYNIIDIPSDINPIYSIENVESEINLINNVIKSRIIK